MIALALLLASSAPTPEATTGPEPSTSGPRPIHLQIDSEALLDEQIAEATADTIFFVRTDGAKALRETHGVQVVEDEAAPAIVVRLSWVSYPESIYGVRIETVRPDQPPQLVESFPCACGDTELSAAVVARLPAALAQLDPPEPTQAHPVVEPAPAPITLEPTPPRSAAPLVIDAPARWANGTLRRPLERIGWVGIGVGAVGAGTLVTGGLVFAQGRRFEPTSGRLERREGLDFEPPGIALMVTGSAALVTGAVLLILDRTRDRRARRTASAMVLPTPRGLVVTGRFGGRGR